MGCVLNTGKLSKCNEEEVTRLSLQVKDKNFIAPRKDNIILAENLSLETERVVKKKTVVLRNNNVSLK